MLYDDYKRFHSFLHGSHYELGFIGLGIMGATFSRLPTVCPFHHTGSSEKWATAQPTPRHTALVQTLSCSSG
jgi:hypothetical protein